MSFGQDVIIVRASDGKRVNIDDDGNFVITLSGDVQIGAVEIKDATSDTRAVVTTLPSGDTALEVLPGEVNPLHTSKANASLAIARDEGGYVENLTVSIAGVDYRKDFARNGDNYVTSVTSWYEPVK